MPRTIRPDDFADPLVQHALVRYQTTPFGRDLDAGDVTEQVVRAALANMYLVLSDATGTITDIRAAIDAALATPPTL